jgi:hypothetical protein
MTRLKLASSELFIGTNSLVPGSINSISKSFPLKTPSVPSGILIAITLSGFTRS